MRKINKEILNRKLKLKSLGLATLLIFTFSVSTAIAQESLNTSGGNASGSGGTASYSIGQIIYQTHSGSNGEVAEGVQQPYEIFNIGIKESELNFSLTAFPNPTTDNLSLHISDYNNEELSYQLFDMHGKLLKNGQIISELTQINMSDLSSATYFVHIVDKENKKINSFKIIKN